MRKIKFLDSLDDELSHVSESDLESLLFWRKNLSKKDFIKLLGPQPQNPQIEIIIPYHNSPRLLDTVNSIKKSYLPKEIVLKILLVASGCTSKFISTAKKVQQQIGKNGLIIDLIIEKQPGKPKALNRGLKSTNNAIVVQIVDDIILEPKALAVLCLSSARHSNFGATVIVGKPHWSGKNNLLEKVQKLHFKNFNVNERYALIGRCFAFQPDLISHHFPEETMSEDFWLDMQVQEKTAGLLIIDSPNIIYSPPKTWVDYLKQVDRYGRSFKQLASQHKNLFSRYYGDIHNSLTKLIAPGARTIRETAKNYVALEEDIGTKVVYLLICLYQIYLVEFLSFIKPYKTATFSREESSL